MKVAFVHVAADSTNPGVCAPVFEDQRFEYIPITYPDEESEDWKLTYRDIPARNKEYGRKLSDFLPDKLAAKVVHLDPDFEFYTYCDVGARGKALAKLKEGDVLFFVASLAPYNETVYKWHRNKLREYQAGKRDKYLIGAFKVRGVALVRAFKPMYATREVLAGEVSSEDVRNSQHYRRLKMGEKTSYVLVVGEPSASFLLDRAFRLTLGSVGPLFVLSKMTRAIFGRNLDSFRGIRWLKQEVVEEGLGGLKEAIAELNPELEDKISGL